MFSASCFRRRMVECAHSYECLERIKMPKNSSTNPPISHPLLSEQLGQDHIKETAARIVTGFAQGTMHAEQLTPVRDTEDKQQAFLNQSTDTQQPEISRAQGEANFVNAITNGNGPKNYKKPTDTAAASKDKPSLNR